VGVFSLGFEGDITGLEAHFKLQTEKYKKKLIKINNLYLVISILKTFISLKLMKIF